MILNFYLFSIKDKNSRTIKSSISVFLYSFQPKNHNFYLSTVKYLYLPPYNLYLVSFPSHETFIKPRFQFRHLYLYRTKLQKTFVDKKKEALRVTKFNREVPEEESLSKDYNVGVIIHFEYFNLLYSTIGL